MRRSYLIGIIFVIGFIFSIVSAMQCEGATALALDVAEPVLPSAQPFTVRVLLTSDADIGAVQFTLDYKAEAISFVGADVGADASGFTVSNINTDLPFPPTGIETTDNVLVQLFGWGTATITGFEQELAVLTFLAAPDCWISPILFDPDCAHTQAAGPGLICDIGLTGTEVSAYCPIPIESRTFGAIKELYR